MKKIIDRIPYWIYNLLTLISSAISVISFVPTIISFFRISIQIKNGKNPADLSVCFTLVCFLIALIGLGFMFFVRAMKYRKLLDSLNMKYAYNYYVFLRSFRNNYITITKRCSMKKDENNSNSISLLTTLTVSFLVQALDCLCNILLEATGQEVSACVKLIVPEKNNDSISMDEAKVFTFCRSTNSKTKRNSNNNNRENNAVFIKKNTDFRIILKDGEPYFYQKNLKEYEKDLRKIGEKYENTTDFYEDYYLSTIVVPIRIDRNLFHDNNFGYEIIGFLCVDSMSINAFRNEEVIKERNVNIVKSFAAELYVILNEYKEKSKEIG